MIRMKVTKSPNLSASTTPKLDAPSLHNSSDEMAAPARPMTPSGPIGIRSPGARKASATIAARAAAVTHDIGTMAFQAPMDISSGPFQQKVKASHQALNRDLRAVPTERPAL